MKTLVAVVLISGATAVAAPPDVVNFDTDRTGQPPAGWTAGQTGGGHATWTVEKDDTAPSRPNVLKQSGVADYPVCFRNDTSVKDGFVEVKFKAISGRDDQAAGLVWRLKDANNYYVARANALENNVTIYHTINGRRTEKKRTSMKVAPNQWHTLRVEFQGPHFTVALDGAHAIDWDDATFKEAGKVGVWTKADSVTLFDDFSFSQPRAAQEPLTFVRAIALPRVEGRIDHLALDASGTKLFVAALGNNTVEVVDVGTGTHFKSLPGFREPQGIAGMPDAALIAVANGHGEGVQTVDATDGRAGRAIRLGEDADNVRYDPATKTLYVGYGSGALAAVNVADGKVLGRAALAGHPESFQLERTGGRIFVNVPIAEHIAVVDRKAMKVVATWPVSGAKSNFPMALDEASHRLFVGCRRPAKVLVYDTTSGKEIGAFDIVGDTDDMFFDAQRQRLYVAGGDGYIDVFDARERGTLPRLARVGTAAGARTALFVPDQGRLYLAVPHRGDQRCEIRVYEVRN